MDAADRKSRWDDQPSSTPPAGGNDAAAAAAAIAAKIAASLRPTGAQGNELVKRENGEEGFIKDIEINDLRNRYVLTKGSTQKQVSSHTSTHHPASMRIALIYCSCLRRPARPS